MTVYRDKCGPSVADGARKVVGHLAVLCLLLFAAGCSESKQDDTVLDTSRLPRVSGAKEVFASVTATTFTSPDAVAVTAETVEKALAATGWQKYVAPSTATAADANLRIMSLKKGQQALGVFITIAPMQANATSVQYTTLALKNDLPFTKDASSIEYAPDRPYLSLVTAEPLDKTLDFYRKELGLRGWSLWSRKLNAKQPADGLAGVIHERGAYAHYVNEQKPTVALVLTEQIAEGGKFKVELKEWPIGILAPDEPKPSSAGPRVLEAGPELSGLPAPKGRMQGSGSSDSSGRMMTANFDADVGTVLAFYRRELAARNWKEEVQGTAVTPEQATVAYSFTGGTAVLKLDRKSDLTAISLVQQIVKPVVKEMPAAKDDAIDTMMKQTLQMAQQADALSGAPSSGKSSTGKPSTKVAQAANEPAEVLQALTGNDAPVPLPDTAEEVEFADGKLEFNSDSNVKSVADFYRTNMKLQGWQAQSSVINNANMVVLNFAKASKTVSFTIVRIGGKTNVSANGSALEAAVKPATPAAVVPVQVSADDLVPEDSSGLPVPKRHTMAASDRTPFRRELKASVPLDLTAVLGFYRRELGKLNWKEESAGAVVTPQNAVVLFSTAEGLAVLKLSRKDGETTVSLAVKNPDAAAKAGLVPKPGQAKLALVNPGDLEATVTINKQTIKVAAGAGTKGPDGPLIDLPPGKHKFSIKQGTRPPFGDEVEIGANEAWGLMLGPGGAMPMQMY